MKVCSECGIGFDLKSVKRKIERIYGPGTYSDYFPDEDVCLSCAVNGMSADYGTGGDQIEDMGSGWDPD